MDLYEAILRKLSNCSQTFWPRCSTQGVDSLPFWLKTELHAIQKEFAHILGCHDASRCVIDFAFGILTSVYRAWQRQITESSGRSERWSYYRTSAIAAFQLLQAEQLVFDTKQTPL